MVSPCYIKVMILAECVHYMMRTRSSVEYVTQNMQTVDNQTLDEITQRCYEMVGTPRPYDCLYNYAEVCLLVLEVIGFVHKFLYNIGVLFRKALAHFGTCIFRRHIAAYYYKTVQRTYIVLFEILLRLAYQFEFLFGIVDKST